MFSILRDDDNEMKRKRLFIRPPLVSIEGYEYRPGYKTYSEYNYLREGRMASYLKTMHFDTALRMTKSYFGRANVIDFGCCDGPFLPSLAKYFPRVLGIDTVPEFVEIASKLCDVLNLNNVDVLCNASLSLKALASRLSGTPYQVLFLLETLEHVGTGENMYGSKIDFLKEVFSLVEDEGIVVISVPKMVGPSFLIQRLGLKMLGMYREPISFTDLWKASLFCDTSGLEKKWTREHLGFNHKTLEKALKEDFVIHRKKDLFFQMIYIVGKRPQKAGRKHSTGEGACGE